MRQLTKTILIFFLSSIANISAAVETSNRQVLASELLTKYFQLENISAAITSLQNELTESGIELTDTAEAAKGHIATAGSEIKSALGDLSFDKLKFAQTVVISRISLSRLVLSRWQMEMLRSGTLTEDIQQSIAKIAESLLKTSVPK